MSPAEALTEDALVQSRDCRNNEMRPQQGVDRAECWSPRWHTTRQVRQGTMDGIPLVRYLHLLLDSMRQEGRRRRPLEALALRVGVVDESEASCLCLDLRRVEVGHGRGDLDVGTSLRVGESEDDVDFLCGRREVSLTFWGIRTMRRTQGATTVKGSVSESQVRTTRWYSRSLGVEYPDEGNETGVDDSKDEEGSPLRCEGSARVQRDIDGLSSH